MFVTKLLDTLLALVAVYNRFCCQTMVPRYSSFTDTLVSSVSSVVEVVA